MLDRILRSRLLSLAGRLLYWLLVALVFWSAAAQRFHLPGLPIAGRDSWGYSHAAFSAFTGGAFEHIYGRNFSYPGFLFLVLQAGGSLAAITVAQHLLGLATGGLMLAAWERLRHFLHVLPRGLHSLGGVLVAAIYLLSSRPVQYEHDLRPEAITPFFAMLNILLTLVFLEQRWGKPPSRRAAITAGAILVNSVVLAALKTSFMVSICFSVVPVLVALFDRRESWGHRRAVLLAGIAALAAFAIPESILSRTDPESRAFLPVSLFSIHANIIAPQMEQDLAQGQCGAEGCEWLRRLTTTLRADMARSWELDQNYRSFHFDPDFLKYDSSSMNTWPARFFDGNKDRMLAFCMHYYWRTWTHRPGAMLRKVGTQIAIFYEARNPSFSKRTRVLMDRLYRDSAENFAGKGAGREQALIAHYVAESQELGRSHAVVRPPLLVRAAIYLLAYFYRIALVVALCFVFAAAFWPRLRRRDRARFALIVLFLFSYNFGSVIGTAVLHSLHILRYNETQYAFSLIAVCAGLVFCLEMSLQFGAFAVRKLRA